MGRKRGASAPLVKENKSRTNWSKSSITEYAVLQWDEYRPTNKISGKLYSMSSFAKSKGIPPQSFYDYARPDKYKRHAMGSQQECLSGTYQHNSEFFVRFPSVLIVPTKG